MGKCFELYTQRSESSFVSSTNYHVLVRATQPLMLAHFTSEFAYQAIFAITMMLEVPVTLKRLSNILGYAGCKFLFLLSAEFFFFSSKFGLFKFWGATLT